MQQIINILCLIIAYIIVIMKNELDDGNYETIINKLTKGTNEQKSNSLKKLNFLYQNARSRIYLYERRITESLQLLLLIEQKQIANLTLNLLQKIISNTSSQSDLFSIIKKRLLSKMVLNLGSVDITTRRISHKCIIEYVRKLRDYQSLILCYIKTGIQQSQNIHLKLKAISSLHSLVAQQSKSFTHGAIYTQILVEQLIYAAYQKQNSDIRRVSIPCLIQIFKIYNAEKTLKMICSLASKQLNDLKAQNSELSRLIDLLLKNKNLKTQKQIEQPEQQSIPSPKFMTLTQEQIKKQLNHNSPNELSLQNEKVITETQLKILNDVTFAQQFLKKLENGSWELDEVKDFAPHLEKYLVDESIKLFSVSKKIVQVIFDSQVEERRQYYVILVPCVVNGIGNKRFIVRKHLDKLVRQYIKNYTEVWVHSFLQRLSLTSSPKIKQILIQLFSHAYKISPEFHYPYQRAFFILQKQVKDSSSNLKWKAIDCLITILQKNSNNQKARQQMMSTLSPEVYHKILRKMNKTHNSVGSNQSLQPLSPVNRKKKFNQRSNRLTTDDPLMYEMQDREIIRKNNISEQKIQKIQQKSYFVREKRIRKSQAQIDLRTRKSKNNNDKQTIREQQGNSIPKLPELKRHNLPSISSNPFRAQIFKNQSPVKRAIGQKNIMYVDKQNLPEISDPKIQLQRALQKIKDSSWNTQFQSISSFRSIIQHHKQLITDQLYGTIMNQLLQCLNNLRSGVSKIAMICLGQLIAKFKKQSYPFTDQIVNTLLKKSLTTSQFIQQQIKRCIIISAQQLCPNRLISSLTALKQNARGAQFKISILGMIDAICHRNQKLYKKQMEWIWTSLIQLHQDHNLNVKNQVRKVVKGIIDTYKNWKKDISTLKVSHLEKIDKIIKNIITSNGTQRQQNWLHSENKQLSKIIQSKTINPKFFSMQLQKLEDLDKQYLAKKNLRQRSNILTNSFNYALQYPQQFIQCPQWRKYLLIAFEHLDQKNPGLLLNSLQILNRCLDNQTLLSAIIQDRAITSILLQKILIASQTKRSQMGGVINSFINNIYSKIGYNHSCKQILKLVNLSLSNSASSSYYHCDLYLNKALNILKEHYDESPRKIGIKIQDAQLTPITRKSEQKECQKNQEHDQNYKQSKFDCIEPYVTKIINRQANGQNIPKLIINKIKQILIICSIVLSPDVYQRIFLNPKTKQILNQKQQNNLKKNTDNKNHLSGHKQKSGTKQLNGSSNNRSLPKQRINFHRNKIKSGDRKFRKRQLDSKDRDLSKQNDRDIRGSHN